MLWNKVKKRQIVVENAKKMPMLNWLCFKEAGFFPWN